MAKADGDEYEQYIDDTGFAAYGKTPGNRGAWMLRRDKGELTEFVTYSLWDSIDAVKAFAGEEHESPSTTPRTSASSSSATTPSCTSRSRGRSRRRPEGWSLRAAGRAHLREERRVQAAVVAELRVEEIDEERRPRARRPDARRPRRGPRPRGRAR